jgi:hypothetical protein
MCMSKPKLKYLSMTFDGKKIRDIFIKTKKRTFSNKNVHKLGLSVCHLHQLNSK